MNAGSRCSECARCLRGVLSYFRPVSIGHFQEGVRSSELITLRKNPRTGSGRQRTSSSSADDYSTVLGTSPTSTDVCEDGEDGFVDVCEYKHLVVMVHGLGGAQEDWNVVKEKLKNELDGDSRVLLYASKVNRKSGTMAGIDVCSERLTKELSFVLRRHPNLKWISFLCHSMGGLIARHACGVNFDPTTGRIFGLQAKHIVTIATPHLGCHVEGESQVPMIGWGHSIPLVGRNVVKSMFKAATSPVVVGMCKRSLQQLFMHDGHNTVEDALILKLVQDRPGEGMFFSALKQFQTRVCYANSSGDALVGWANASLRRVSELPVSLNASFKGRGILMEDELHLGCWKFDRIEESGSDESQGDERQAGDESPGSTDIEFEFEEEVNYSEELESCTNDSLMVSCETFESDMDKLESTDRKYVVDYMLDKLQSLPWCRIDVAFKKKSVPFMAHTHIQVTRKWLDFVGISVAKHIAERFVDLEELVSTSSGR